MRTIWRLAIPAALLAATAGCACRETAMERNYGASYKMEIANQTLDPEASQNLQPVTGMEAPEAAKVYESYVKGFEKPAGSVQTYIIPIGDGGSFSNNGGGSP